MRGIDRVRIGHPTHLPAKIADRSGISSARRIVVKIGSSSLTLANGQLDRNAIWMLASSVSRLVNDGREVVIVSSGAIAAALRPTGLSERPSSTQLSQALASIGQGLLISAWSQAFGENGVQVGQVLLTEDDVADSAKYRNIRAAMQALLEFGVVPIVNENDTVATQEIQFGDNDRLASLVAQVIGADLLVLLTDVDGLYTKPPKDPGAVRISVVEDASALDGVQIGSRGSKVGTGGMVTKLAAAHNAAITGTATLLTLRDNFDAAVSGKDCGTFFPAQENGRRHSRLMWLKYASKGDGTLVLDDGAVDALVKHRRSLLPVGIVEVSGDFAEGMPVDIADQSGRVVARGLTYFSARDLRMLIGKTSDQIAQELGEDLAHYVVHRDELVVLGH